MAQQALTHCRTIASFTDEPGVITRTFLSPATKDCHKYLSDWMERLGMAVSVDAVGNLRGLYPGRFSDSRRLIIGSHLDTVPNAGAYDGVLGVVMGLLVVEALRGERLSFAIEAIGFSEEEGIRFGVPFIGSRAVTGTLDERTLALQDAGGVTVSEAIRQFGSDPMALRCAELASASAAFLEFHIEQGPVLENLDLPVGVVSAIAGQSRAVVEFHGKANHAGTTPMHLRRDALCATAEWIVSVEDEARAVDGLVATVGRIEVKPGAANVIPGETIATFDVRHGTDQIRWAAFAQLLQTGAAIAGRRGLKFDYQVLLDQPAVEMDADLTRMAEDAIRATGANCHRMVSGAGHDAMILAPRLPSAMIFVRSPGGISHHREESVLVDDIAVALRGSHELLRRLSTCHSLT